MKYVRVPRIQDLMNVDQKIREALLERKDNPELLRLRDRIQEEIRSEIRKNGGTAFIAIED